MCDNRNSVGAALSRENCVDTNAFKDWQPFIAQKLLFSYLAHIFILDFANVPNCGYKYAV